MRPLLIIVLVILSSCSRDLERSIFIKDPEFPELPKYSEWGLNTFGVYIDRVPFISNDVDRPAKVILYDEKLSFTLAGDRHGVYFSPSNLSLNFVFSPAQNVEDYVGLVQLHDTSWDLTDENMLVIFSEAANTDTLKILNGTLKFTRAQHLFVDKVSEEAILSGTFEFQANYNGTFTTFSNGRFDVGISKNNFYRP
jgi:hypothetical protein